MGPKKGGAKYKKGKGKAKTVQEEQVGSASQSEEDVQVIAVEVHRPQEEDEPPKFVVPPPPPKAPSKGPEEEEEEQGDDDEVEPPAAVQPTAQPIQTKRKRQKKTEAYPFSVEQENDIGEWYRDNEILYNKRHQDFKNTEKKNKLFEDKAASLDPPCTRKYNLSYLGCQYISQN